MWNKTFTLPSSRYQVYSWHCEESLAIEESYIILILS